MRPSARAVCLRALLLLASATLSSGDADNSSSLQSVRTPRVSGRIVKVYSHPRQEGFRCPGEGFHADPTNCLVFYRCVGRGSGKFTIFRFQCGPNTVYDPETGVCNFPTSTRRTECGGNHRLPAPSTEGSRENEIDYNEPDLSPPSPISTKKPNPPGTSTIKYQPTTSVAPWVTQQRTTTRPKPAPSTKSPKQESSSNSDDQCTKDGFIGDSKSCRKFYRCISNGRGGFIRYEFSCSEPTVWDDNIQACNHAWAAKSVRCGRGEIDDKNKKTKEDTTTTKSNSNQSQVQINSGSNSSQDQTQINYGDRVKQNQYQFNNGSQSSQTQTQVNDKYDSTSQAQKQVNFGDRNTQSQIQINHSKQSSQTQTQSSYNTKTTAAPSNGYYGSNDSPQKNEYEPSSTYTSSSTESSTESNKDNRCTASGFMGDSKDCKKFYRCVDNGKGGFIRYEFACGEGTVWDANIEACNHLWAVKECGGNSKEDVNKVEQTTKAQSSASQTTTTSKVTQSTSYSTTEDDDDDDGQGYSRPTQRPLTDKTQQPAATTSTTTTEKTKPSAGNGNECTSSGFMGDSNDCKKFYRCVDNGRGSYTRYEFSCGEGTVWDANAEACNHAWAVKECGGSKEDIHKLEQTTKAGTTSSQITTSKPTQAIQQSTTEVTDDEDQGYGQPTTAQSKKPPTTTTEKTKPTNKDNECTSSGFMGDIEDCKKFYRCVDNGRGSYTRYEFACGEGTVWDPNAEACNHAWAVKKCGGISKEDINKVEQTTKSEATSTSTTPQNTTEDHLQDEDPGYGQQHDSQYQDSTTSTTEKSDTSNQHSQCTSSGFIGDSKDCKKFYRCVDNGRGGYIRYEFSCGEGTVWDQSNEACNHAWAVKECGGRPASENDKVDQTTQSATSTTSSQVTAATDIHDDQGYGPPKPSPTTTQKPDSSIKDCSKEGFMGDSKDCKTFYRCVDNGKGGYTKYEFTCGDGTVWDQDIQACNHESMAKNCGASTSRPSSSTDNEVDSGYGQEPEHDEEVTSTSKPTDQPSSEATTDSMISPQSDDKCSGEGFYPDSNDCKKFYRCVDNGRGGYTKYDFTCGEGTVWDQDVQACNHPTGDTKCKTGSSQTNKPDPEGTTQSSLAEATTNRQDETTSKEDQTASQTTRKPSQSSGECTSEGFYSDKNDCKKFYRCVDNGKGGYTKYEFTCGDGTVWDQEIQGCNFESNVKNCHQSSDSPTTQQSETSQSTERQTTENVGDQIMDNGQTTSSKPSSDGGSGGKCNSEGFYPNKNNCKKFYRCVDNGRGGYTRYDFECGEGTAWDQDAQTCNYEGSVDCQSSSQSGQSKPESPTPDQQQDEQQDDSSDKPLSESSSQESTTSKQQSSSGKCEQEGFFGNPDNCKKFYRCVDNGKGGYTKYDFDCGEGTIWDQDVQTCNHPGDVQNPSCRQGGDGSQSSTTSSSSQQSTSSTTESSSSQTEQPSSSSQTEQPSSSSQSESSSKPSSSNITCPEAGFYANPDDCKKFYRCVDYEGEGKSYTVFHFDCGEGTVWDPNLDTCNYEDSIYPPRDCSKQSQSQEVDSSEESETSTSSSTNTESSTTEQSTTQEPSTTKSTTTTETTTTQQETTTQQSTTQTSTTQEETTTEQQTTTQQSITQQSSTTESPTTTQQSTTTQSQTTTTEQESTTKQETTTQQETTTKQETTTQESTTQQQESQTTEEGDTATTESESTTKSQTESQTEGTTEEQTTEEQTSEGTTEGTAEGTTEEQTEGQSETTTEESATDSTTEEGGTTESSSSDKECPETDDDQYLLVCPTGFRRHPKYCNLFYQCTEDSNNHDIKVGIFHCQNNTIYDESKTQCVEESEADKKCDGETAERRRFKRLNADSKPPISVVNARLKCPAEGHFPFDKKDGCSPAFLKCEQPRASQKMRGFVYRCPEGFIYWAVSRRCEHTSKMPECRARDNTWKERWEIPVETKNMAP